MADNLIFPIGFDLEEAVKKAGQEWNSTYADKLEKLLAKRAITVNLGFSTKNLNNLDDVKRRLAELKIEPLTPENKTAIKDLVRELKELAKAMEKVQKYSKIQTPELQQALANKANAEAAHMAEKYRQANERLEVSKRRVALAEQKHAEALSNTSKKINEQHSYVSRLIKRMAVYASFSYAGNFLTSVREVTAQFELQRVSLGAIIQDQTRANALFSEIKAFALKSPVSILDLTKYTKQIAAYRIETEKLFDTTKMLTDISVGLGVDLQRITLFFGQVRARGALFSSEIRQATEAGIPLVELLAKKYSELNGQLVTASQVLKMVEKGMVGFEMVEEIFKDMTSAGGMFYEMQEKQGNTLYGLWAKLGDAAAVMYDEIGNTSSVNAGMKAAIQALTDLMKNWRDVARIATEAGIAFAVYRLAVIGSTKATALATVWEKKDIVLRQMHLKTVMAQSMHVRNFNRVLLASGVSAQKASTATWVFSRALHGLKAAIATTGIGALIIGLSLLIDRLLFSKSAAEQLKESLDNIETESIQEQDKSVRNFERLANIAVSASSTYKEQQAALEELKRTYKEIIPQEQLTIENLKQMNGNYELLTASIRRYIAERMKQKQTDEIINTYASEILKIQRKVNDQLKNKYSAEQLAAFWEKYTEIVKDASKSAGKSVSELINMTVSAMGADLQFAHDIGSVWTLFAHDHADVSRMTTLIREQERQIDALSKTYDSASMAMGEYAKSYSEAVDKITQDGLKLNGKVIKQEDNPLLYSQQEANLEIKDAMIPTIKEAFNAAGIAFNDGWTSLIDNVDENMPQLTSSINFDPMVEKVNEESQKLLAELQKQLDALVAQREAYLKQIKAEESKGKGGNNEVIQNAKTRYNEIGDEIEKLEERARKINILPQLLEHLKKKYEDLAPSDSVVKLMRQRFDSIVDYTKAYAKNMRRFRMNADEDMEAYRKRLSDEVELIKKNIKAWTAAMILARLFRNKTEEQNLQNLIDEAKLQLKDLEKILGDMPVFDKSKSRGTKSDPRLQTLQEIANKMAEVNKEYDELLKKEGQTKALADTQKLFASSFEQMKATAKKYGFKLPAFEVPQTIEDVQKWYKAIMDNIKRLNLKNADKVLIELGFKSDKAAIDKQQKDIEAELKRLSDRISRTKTAKEFYEKILGMTGDVELAANVSLQIYGSTGRDLKEQVKEQFAKAFEGLKNDHADIVPDVTDIINRGAYEELRDYIALLPEAQRKAAEDLVKAQQQMSVKQYEQWLKDLEKAKDYADKRIELSRYTANQIAAIEERIAKLNPQASDYEQQKAMLEKLIAGYKSREDKIGSELEYEQFKNSALYVQVFENLDNASKTALENMRNRLLALKDQWKNLSPEKVKELTKRLEELDAQIAQRNPFKSIADNIKKLREMRMGGRTKEGDAQKAFDAETNRQIAEAKMLADEKAYEAAVKQYGAESDIAKEKRKIADDSAEAYRKAEKTADSAAENADEWEKVAEAINAANQKLDKYQEQINEALGGIRKIMESFGASAEDMQFFDDVTNGFNEIFDAGQQGAAAYADFMQGNFIGAATKGISAVGSLISGVTNLFYAGRVKRANKEIKRQQKLLEQLEYTYGRLEKAAEEAFGADYINNYKQQIKMLQAQQTAYMRMAEAERSKGKDEDAAKTQEYLNSAREIGDRIADIQKNLAAQLLGSDIGSAARDFAQAWLDAYREFDSTTDAMSKKFKEMVEQMVANSVIAQVMKKALEPTFEMINRMQEGDFYSERFWERVVKEAERGAEAGAHGAEVIARMLEKAGVNLRDSGSEYTGIAKDVAGASSEEVLRLSGFVNTALYYISPIPRMDENLARVVEIMEQGGASASTPLNVTEAGWTDWQRQAMENYNAIARNTAETVVECRRAADACGRIAETFKVKGSTRGLNVFLNQ